MRRETKLRIRISIMAAAAFGCGLALPKMLKMHTGTYAGLLSLYSLQKYQLIEKGRTWKLSGILPYVLSVRIRTLLFLWMSGFTPAGLLCHLGYFGWLFLSGGMLLAVFLLRMGERGILVFLCCLLPQWMIYCKMFREELSAFKNIYQKGREPIIYRKEHSDADKNEVCAVIRGNSVTGELKKLLYMMLLCIAGCFTEVLLGRWTTGLFMRL